MTQNLSSLSEHDLAALIADTSKELEKRRQNRIRETMAEIRTLAHSIGADVRFWEDDPAGRHPVPVKYQDPSHPDHAWSGRGARPRWLRAYLEQGRSIEEFRV